jgi:predicted  nucleic acid-binding Zn ribbon protein
MIAELTFNCNTKITDKTDDAIWLALAALYKNGQIFKEYVLAKKKKGYIAVVGLPEKTALKKMNNSKWVNHAYENLAKLNLNLPKIKMVSDVGLDSKCCNCESPQSYIIYTHYLDQATPLMCGDCWSLVPIYRVIPPNRIFENNGLLGWQQNYIACDTLQMHCDTGERFAIREMSKYDSSLSKRGLEVCREIEKSTGKPVYYYLYYPRAKSREVDTKRKCPSCNGEWLLEKTFLSMFDFRCDKCRLLSNIAWNVR